MAGAGSRASFLMLVLPMTFRSDLDSASKRAATFLMPDAVRRTARLSGLQGLFYHQVGHFAAGVH